MRKLHFKLIPFIISLLIVVVSTTLLCIYAYRGYDTNKIRFVNEYFHLENHSTVPATEQIENYSEFSNAYYRMAGDEFTFTDVKSGNQYNETPSQNSKNFIDGATYSNGILHLNGWFDLIPYASTTYNSDAEEYIYTFYLYVFNVNYKYQSLIRNLNFCFVEGIGNDPTKFVGTYKLDTVIDEIKGGTYLGANGTNLPTYTYKGEISESEEMHIYDDKATGDFKPDGAYVYRLTTMSETLSDTDQETVQEKRWLWELENATFSIYYTGEDANATKPDNFIELVRGTFNRKYSNAEEFNAANCTNDVLVGAQTDLYKAGYGSFITKRVVITGLITFGISSVLAFLFYLIWQGDDEPKDKIKLIKEKKK